MQLKMGRKRTVQRESARWRWLHAQAGCLLMAMVIVGSVCGAAQEEGDRAQGIAWRNGEVGARPAMTHDAMARVAAFEKSRSRMHVLVQFTKALPRGAKAQLRFLGLELLAPLDGHAYFARLTDAPLNVDAIAAHAPLARLERISAAWKLHPILLSNAQPHWAVVSGDAETGHVMVAMYVLLHRGANQDAAAAQMEALGGIVRSKLRSLNGLVIELPAAKVWDAAGLDAVQWIEPALPPLAPQNDVVRASIGADVLQESPFGLDGSAVKVMVYDAGHVDGTHPDLAGRVTTHDNANATQHATHVAGIVGGSGLASSGLYRGMAPNVSIESFAFEPNVEGIALYNNPGDIERDYREAIEDVGVDLANNSIGSNIAVLGLPCELEGDYSLVSALVDSIAGGAFERELPIVWAAGNERVFPALCGSGWRTIPPPASAKNPIVVGAVYSDFDQATMFTSYGPTDDGRIKPDLVAPGCEASGDNGVTSSNLGGGYIPLCGTSMAAPAVSGAVALMMEDYRQQASAGAPDPSPAMIKAVLVQTALDLWHPGPDYRYGFGLVRADLAVDHLRSDNGVEGAVDQGVVWEAPLMVEPGTSQLVATLAWTDPPGTPNVTDALVNDLDMVIVGPDGEFFPWTLNPSTPGQDAVRTGPDRLNNVEQVVVDDPTPGIWQIQVIGHDVPDGPQTFAVASGSTIVRIEFNVPGGALTELPAGATTQFDVDVSAIGQGIVAQTLHVHYRLEGETIFQSHPMASFGGTRYAVRLPATQCGEVVEYYLSAAGSVSGQQFDPPLGPQAPYRAAAVEEPLSISVANVTPIEGGLGEPTGFDSDDSSGDVAAEVVGGVATIRHRCFDPIPVGDVDGNHHVDGFDLGNVLFYWGTSEITADFDGSWLVDGADLAIVLYNWGS